MTHEKSGQHEPVNVDEIRGHDGLPWPLTMDAVAWADAWMALTQGQPDMASDRAEMVGWFANAIMAGFDTANRQAAVAAEATLTASEALYGFMGWLTTRPETLTVGGSEECGPVVELITAFLQRHGLPEPRRHWQYLLKPPGDACQTCGASGQIMIADDLLPCPDCPGLR